MYTGPARKPTRARGYDYREPGAYFVTICEHRRQNRFGDVRDGEMRLSAAGEMVWRGWHALATKFPTASFGLFVGMPNHVHGLVTLGMDDVDSNPSLSTILGWFKTMTTNWYLHGVRDQHWPPYDGRLWQRSFHDRIVRTDAEMDRIRTYIATNPAVWTKDTFFEP